MFKINARLCYGAQRGRARRESPIASLDLSTLYVDKVEFGHLSLREGIQSFVEKVDRSLMTLDTYPRNIGKPLSKASLALALTHRSSLYILVSL